MIVVYGMVENIPSQSHPFFLVNDTNKLPYFWFFGLWKSQYNHSIIFPVSQIR